MTNPLKIKENIVLIGSGKLATSLAFALKKAGRNIDYIYSRSLTNAQKLGEATGIQFTDKISDLPQNAALYIISITDSAIEEIITQLKISSGIVVHTSGSVEMDIIKPYDNYGVFYPLMQFTNDKITNFKNVPVCIEASNVNNFQYLKTLAEDLSAQVYAMNSDQRRFLHLGAVFVCNFTNLNYVIAEEILAKQGLSFDIFGRLISETASKAIRKSPATLQTGPAVRKDYNIIEKHIALLAEFPEYQEIYRLLTQTIIDKKNKNEL